MAASDLTAEPRLRVGIVPFNAFTLAPFAGFVDVLRLAADEGDRSRQRHVSWSIMTSTGAPVRASCGTAIPPDSTFTDPDTFDYIVAVGGLLHGDAPTDPATDRFLCAAAAANVPIVGLCTAVFTLVRLGLMSGRACCVSWYHYRDLEALAADAALVPDRLFVVDGPRITCAGGTAAVDVAAWLVERHVGRAEAEKALHILLAGQARASDAPQPRPAPHVRAHDDRLRRAIDAIEENLADPLSVDRLARTVGVSRRQLERIFRRDLGRSPLEFALDRRLEQGHWLLMRTDQPVTAIAHACGFADGSHFARHFRATYGASPQAMRSAGEAAVDG